jgi:hypothetical protein
MLLCRQDLLVDPAKADAVIELFDASNDIPKDDTDVLIQLLADARLTSQRQNESHKLETLAASLSTSFEKLVVEVQEMPSATTEGPEGHETENAEKAAGDAAADAFAPMWQGVCRAEAVKLHWAAIAIAHQVELHMAAACSLVGEFGKAERQGEHTDVGHNLLFRRILKSGGGGDGGTATVQNSALFCDFSKSAAELKLHFCGQVLVKPAAEGFSSFASSGQGFLFLGSLKLHAPDVPDDVHLFNLVLVARDDLVNDKCPLGVHAWAAKPTADENKALVAVVGSS